jgi:capsular exopolysaccharide synthesis family protein
VGKINITNQQMPYAVEEALNRLRINIKFCGKNTKKILVVSSVPNEGKSFVSVQLWRMLAEAGFRSVLVDADLRRSILKRRHSFQCDEEIRGLDYYISGQAEYSDVVYETNIENADIIPCSSYLENPSPLFEDPRLHELFDKLSEEYRYVIVDAPPLYNVSDGSMIASHCDGAILVVNAAETSKTLVTQSLQQLERSGCSLLGMVLNKAEVAHRSYYRYYGKYGKYYGDYYYGGNSTRGN